MPVAITPPDVRLETEREDRVRGSGGAGGGSGSDQGSDRWRDGGRRLRPDSYQLGMWLALASISMMFVGFSSAYILGQGTHGLWRAMAAPPFVWVNTAILLASSLTLEVGAESPGRSGVEAMDDPDLFAGNGLFGGPALGLEAFGRPGHLPERQSP